MSTRAVDPARSRIVLVGSPAYDDPGLLDVPAVANNLADLAAVLTDPDLGGFAAAHCAVAPARSGVVQIGDLLVDAAAEAEDLLLFYYSGHGMLGPLRRELYLSLVGTRTDRLAFTALHFDAIRDVFLASRARSRVVILDSCFSGRAIGETLAGAGEAVLGQIQVAGTYTLTSAPANQTALILPGERNTAFTGRLLTLLRAGSPTAGHWISLGDIYRHLCRQLLDEGLPVPQQRGTATADLLGLVRNRHVALAARPESTFHVRSDGTVTIGRQGLVMHGRDRTTTVIFPDSEPPVKQASDLGPDHLETLVARREFASRLGYNNEGGSVIGRIHLYRKLIPDMVRALGPDHTETLLTRYGLAFNVSDSGDWAEAVRLFRELVLDAIRVLGPDDFVVLVARRQLAFNVGEGGDRAEARRLYRELIQDLARALGPDHEQTLAARRQLAFNVGEGGDQAEAVQRLGNLIPRMVCALGADHFETLVARRGLAYYVEASGDPAEAVRLLRDLVSDQLSVLGADHSETLAARQQLAFSIGQCGDQAEAIRLYQELVLDLDRVLGSDHEETLRAREEARKWAAGDRF